MNCSSICFRLFTALILGILYLLTAESSIAQTPERVLVLEEADLFDADGRIVGKATEGDVLVVLFGGGDKGLLRGGRTIAAKHFTSPFAETGKALLEKLIAADTKNPEHFRLRARNREYAKDYEGMVADYTRVIELEPKETAGYLSRANAWMQLKKYDNALADLKEVSLIDPEKRSSTLNGLVNVYKAKNDWQQVVQIYSEMLGHGKQYGKFYEAQTLAFRGAAHEKLEQWNQAKADYAAALQLNPRNREAAAGLERVNQRE